jgi:hypothetical protein
LAGGGKLRVNKGLGLIGGLSFDVLMEKSSVVGLDCPNISGTFLVFVGILPPSKSLVGCWVSLKKSGFGFYTSFVARGVLIEVTLWELEDNPDKMVDFFYYSCVACFSSLMDTLGMLVGKSVSAKGAYWEAERKPF